MKREMNQLIGAAMFSVGAAIFLVAAFMQNQTGSVPAAAFLLIIMGIGCYFPELFQDGSSSPSTMRICVIMIVSVFVVMVVKTGWTNPNFLQYAVHESWLYLVGAALGAKVLQSLPEYFAGRLGKKGGDPHTPAPTEVPETKTNTVTAPAPPTNGVKLHYPRNVLAGDPDDYDV